MERRALQAVLGVLSLIPLLGAVLVWGWGAQFFFGKTGGVAPANLDNQLRYLAGVYLGAVTFGLWWAILRIEERGIVVTLVGVAVFVGGIGRVISLIRVGMPQDPAMIVGMVLELGVVPFLVLWQRRVARLAAQKA